MKKWQQYERMKNKIEKEISEERIIDVYFEGFYLVYKTIYGEKVINLCF